MQKTIIEAQKLFESISCLGVEGVEFYTQREIIDAILREAQKGYELCKATSQQSVEANAENKQPDCDYCRVSVYAYCPRCGKKRTA